MAQRKNPELDAKHQAILRKMMQMSENKTCADCRGPSPRWASTNLGVFVCISCSGIHRKLGTHISQVRSVTLDTWTPAQIAHFTKFGNARAAKYFEACIPPNFERPQPGDSMQMEKFIRDKYERKRYITVENGGLGGGSAEPLYRSNGGSSFGGGLGSRPSQLESSLSYSNGGYDSAQTTRRTGGSSYNSYGGRFGSGLHRSPRTGTGQVEPRRTGGISTQVHSILRGRPVNAMQRASTMKELINMGFSPQHAARAVEATNGDLQRAVDWVLEHKDEGSQSKVSSIIPQPPKEPPRDLLDFSDPEPAPQVKERPRVLGSETLMPTNSNSTQLTSSKRKNELADFADFGAFESALPAVEEQSSVSSTTAMNGSLSSTIKNIYKQSPPQGAQPCLKGMPSMPRLDQPKQVTSPQSQPIRTKPSPRLMAQKAAEASKKVPEADLGLTSFTGLATSPYQCQPANIEYQSSKQTITYEETFVKPNGTEAPPPPPPPQVSVTPKSTYNPQSRTPPPPDTPPPKEEKPTELTTSPIPSSGAVDDSILDSQDSGQDDNTATNSTDQPASQLDAEDEDPFAALSIMAMKSAKSSTKRSRQASGTTLQNGANGILDSRSTAPRAETGITQDSTSVGATAGIDLDELLG